MEFDQEVEAHVWHFLSDGNDDTNRDLNWLKSEAEMAYKKSISITLWDTWIYGAGIGVLVVSSGVFEILLLLGGGLVRITYVRYVIMSCIMLVLMIYKDSIRSYTKR